MCDKKNSILFTESECLILSPSFKLLDESQVVLRAPRKDDVYSLDLKNIVPSGGITCLYANATADESKLWHRRLGHVNFKNINKLVKGHLVRGLPSKVFVNDHTCVACKKGKQHKASCKAKLERIIRKPLELLHMDLFGPVSVESINKKRYCLVVTDDFSRFSWVFFLATKDETSEILCKFDGKSDEGYLLGYSTSSKAFRVYNKRTKRVEENLHINFLEDQPNVVGTGLNWMFDLDFLTTSMNHIPDKDSNKGMLFQECTSTTLLQMLLQKRIIKIQRCIFDNEKKGQHQMPKMSKSAMMYYRYVTQECPIPTVRIHKDHPKGQILGDPTSAVQTRGKIQKASSTQQALFARIEAIRLFLAFASYMGFLVYQMDVKSAFLYDTIKEEVYVHQPPGFVDPAHPNKVYKVVKALYGLHQAPRAWIETLSIDSYRRNGFLERPDIKFAVCACARFSVTSPKLPIYMLKRDL
ncbi:putative ribonuclease H-like domain-containing protein [Tanacetum coccineum]